MAMNLEELTAEALQLDLETRAELAQRILLSLVVLSDDEVEKLWIEEAQLRYKEYLGGKVEAIPAEEVFRRLADDMS